MWNQLCKWYKEFLKKRLSDGPRLSSHAKMLDARFKTTAYAVVIKKTAVILKVRC